MVHDPQTQLVLLVDGQFGETDRHRDPSILLRAKKPGTDLHHVIERGVQRGPRSARRIRVGVRSHHRRPHDQCQARQQLAVRLADKASDPGKGPRYSPRQSRAIDLAGYVDGRSADHVVNE
jgi:hypothetical protein